MRAAAFVVCALASGLALTGCEEGAGFALPGGAETALDQYPVRKAACVDAVRREIRSVDVRAETAEVMDGGTPEAAVVVFGLVAGPEATPWTCTADNSGAVSNVGRVPVPEPAPEPEAGSAEPDEGTPAES